MAHFRAISVGATPAVVFRWLCQLKVAPYSYDLVDNPGRRSPRSLTPGVERLAVGQRFLVFTLVDFEPDRHLTGVSRPAATRIFGPLAISYAVRADGDGARLVVKLVVGSAGPLGAVRRYLLGWGDVVMMRKQLLNLRDLAEGGRPPPG